MNWITDFVPPKIKSFFQRREMPENLWSKCESCGQMIFHRELAANFDVCHHCGHHQRLAPDRRLAMLFDEGSHQVVELPRPPADPLRFRDGRRYSDRLREAQQRTGRHDAIVVAVRR